MLISLALALLAATPPPAAYRTTRWLVRGIGAELLTNLGGRGGRDWRRQFLRPNARRAPADGDGALAVVTGATGGIGAEVCAGLAACGYHVIVAARDRARGRRLAAELRRSGGRATFVRLELDSPRTVIALAEAVGSRPCALLVNNAGVMGVRRDQIIATNLVGPAVLTLALLPALRMHRAPRVVNVASSSHLRAGRVEPSMASDGSADADLSAYAQSKLGLMQLSTLLRSSLPWLEVCDAHPGLVWTPMLQRHWGGLALPLERAGVARAAFKTPAAGATTVLAAAFAPRVPPRSWGERSRWRRGWEAGPYFVNGRPTGCASRESRDVEAAREMWRAVIEPEARRIVPDGCRELSRAQN